MKKQTISHLINLPEKCQTRTVIQVFIASFMNVL